MAAVATCVSVFAQGHTFTYQGKLDNGGRAATGIFDFKFSAWSDESAGSTVAAPCTNLAVMVSNGIFRCLLDFGATFDGGARWIEVGVRTNGGGDFWTLLPRQAVTPAPYAIHAGSVSAGGIAPGTVTSNMLAAGAAAGNLAQSGQTAVPAAAVMFSTQDKDTNLLASGYVRTGGYVAAQNLWRERNSQRAPSPRTGHAAVWTGSKMIVWGGQYDNNNPSYPPARVHFQDGGVYDYANDRWDGISTNGAPPGREDFFAVWTGEELIVWGGFYYDGSYNYRNDGGRYRPATDTWLPLSTNGAPSGRRWATAVWTGSEMIIWGGDVNGAVRNGSAYDLLQNAWTELTLLPGAPAERLGHSAVWTGSEMLIFGGTDNSRWFGDLWGCVPPRPLFLYSKP